MIEQESFDIKTEELDNGKFRITWHAIDIADATDVINNANSLRNAIFESEKLLADIDKNTQHSKDMANKSIEENKKRLTMIESAEKKANEIIAATKPVEPAEKPVEAK